VGFDVPVWWDMQLASVSDRSGSADGFVASERVLVGCRIERAGSDLRHAVLRLLSESLFTSQQRSGPVAQRGVNEHLYRCNWHTKAVMRITTRSDSRPRRSQKLSLKINLRAIGAGQIDLARALTCSSDYFLHRAHPDTIVCLPQRFLGGGHRK
jgi:hypothetical protein